MTNNQPAKILIVDDQPFNIDTLEQELEDLGHLTISASNGREALALLATELPDLILLDIMMPEMNGFEVLQHLRANETWRTIPVIITSANNDLNSMVKGIELGAADYLSKPVNDRLLRARVTASLAQRQMRLQEMELLQKEAELKRHRALFQMVAGVAHELNTPLGVVNMAADMIKTDLHDELVATSLTATKNSALLYEEMTEASQLLHKNIQRAHDLVQNFKQLALRQADDKPESVELPTLITEIVDLFRINARQADLTIRYSGHLVQTATLDPEISYSWYGYPRYLTQILLNLLANIERHAYPNGKGGDIEISLDITNIEGMETAEISTVHASHFILTVHDFGCGIAPESLSQIFTPFFTTARGRGGSGLGLAIVYNLATEALHGQIQVDSHVGEGTAVTITFPRASE